MMKHVSAALIAAAAICMLLPSLVFADGADADGEGTETGQTYISGYIYEPLSSGNGPIEGATVTVKMTLSDGNVIRFSAATGSDGRFDVNITEGFDTTATFGILFALEDYTMRNLPQSVSTSTDSEGYYTLTLPTSTTTDGNTYYMLTDDMSQSGSDLRVVLMASTTSTLTIRVIYVGDFIEGAKVTISKVGDSDSNTVESNSRGYAEFNNISVGEYSIVVKADGFETYESTVTVGEGGTTTDANLTERTHTHYLWGFDIAHVMMLAGLLIGIFMAAAAWALHRTGKKLDS